MLAPQSAERHIVVRACAQALRSSVFLGGPTPETGSCLPQRPTTNFQGLFRSHSSSSWWDDVAQLPNPATWPDRYPSARPIPAVRSQAPDAVRRGIQEGSFRAWQIAGPHSRLLRSVQDRVLSYSQIEAMGAGEGVLEKEMNGFLHRMNPDGSHSSICPDCLRTISTEVCAVDLAQVEENHICDEIVRRLISERLGRGGSPIN
jgi:hypothetical protein